MARHYTVSDGRLVLTLTRAEEGGFVVTSPFDPELVTEAETLEQAFDMARDALRALRASRTKLLQRIASQRRSARTVAPSSAISAHTSASFITTVAATTCG
jgi:predicted RNase H-like HicB family nuclease